MTAEPADSDSFLILPERSAGVYSPAIDVFYREEQVPQAHSHRVSQSPLKPRYFMRHLENTPCQSCILLKSDWPPLDREDFLIAHTTGYVDAFFSGVAPLRSSNGLGWSPEFADSIRFNNASLFHSIRSAVLKPSTICLSPTSGFHHAIPTCGGGFCTFSGQVVSSIKILREFGLRGAYLDLDGHFGNSIEDSRDFAPELNEAVPRGFNINPAGVHQKFLDSLRQHLETLESALVSREIHYVVFCHGADSHCLDDLGYHLTTEEWLECSRLVYTSMRKVSGKLGRPVPLSLALFGGYRSDHYESVLNLHVGDLVICLNTLCGQEIEYEVRVRRKE